MRGIEELRRFIERSLRDPVAGALLKHSNLTRTQYETLIIDLLTENVSDDELTYSDKALLRSKKVSRGSISRTLSQARGNIASAVYTVLLLCYIGFLREAPFDPYQILSERLRDYVKFTQDLDPDQMDNVVGRVGRELVRDVRELAEPASLKVG